MVRGEMLEWLNRCAWKAYVRATVPQVRILFSPPNHFYCYNLLMKYIDYLKTHKECPFCNRIKHRTLVDNEYAILTYAQAPYHKYHLIVVPKRHVDHIKDLSWDENICIMALLVNAIKILDKIGHDDCAIVAKDGRSPRSIGHTHYHIIPSGVIEDISINNEVRKMLTDDEEESLRKELKKSLKQ
jgi:ATP adenylyltransferase